MNNENANHLILIAGILRELNFTPEKSADFLDKDGEKNREFWNKIIEIRNNRLEK